MPYTTVVAGTVATASWANANVRDQGVTPFADAAARSAAIGSPLEGMVSYLTGSNRLDIYNSASYSALINPAAGAWVDWSSSAQIQQPASYLSRTVTLARYIRVGRKCTYAFEIALTGSGTAGQHVNFLLPFDHAFGAAGIEVGTGSIYDADLAQKHRALIHTSTASASLAWFESVSSVSPDGRLGAFTFTTALASGDAASGCLTYMTSTDD